MNIDQYGAPSEQLQARRPVPNLFVVGAAKAGTTTLYSVFAKHPEIYVPSIKETNFMAYEDQTLAVNGPGDKLHAAARSITSACEYLSLYTQWHSEPYAADVSPVYLSSDRAAAAIKSYSPEAKIIMVIRNPVEAAYSMYAMMRRDQRERQRSFIKAFDASQQRIALGWEHGWNLKQFTYATHIRRYLDTFETSQLFICRYELLRDDPDQFLSSLKSFLGLRTAFDYAGTRANASPTQLRQLRKHSAVRRILKLGVAGVIPAPLKGALRQRLDVPAYSIRPKEYNHALAYYRDEIRMLGCLLDWDVESWLAHR